ncbi:MAG: hypothetical protein JXX28_16800, partial [Deltaproteobacteria bacterium]|nr:hypothetical protein [Deltaproteobacteria bacterium]
LRGMLAWEPEERPSLYAVAEGLRRAGDATGGEDLADWADVWVADLLQEPHHHAFLPHAGLSMGEEDTDASVDEATKEATVLEEVGGGPPRHGARPETPGAIPVYIGPPPEAMSPRASLPPDFLDSGNLTPLIRRRHRRVRDTSVWAWAALFGLGVALLALLALLLMGWGLTREPEPERPLMQPLPPRTEVVAARPQLPPVSPLEEPALPPPPEEEFISPWGPLEAPEDSESAEVPPPEPLRFEVLFTAPPDQAFEVRCGPEFARGQGSVRLLGLSPGPCTLTAGALKVEVELEGSAEFYCFPSGSALCVQQEVARSEP